MKFATALSVSVAALIGASSGYAVDSMPLSHAVLPTPLATTIQVRAFSWDSFYLGAQSGITFRKNAKISDMESTIKADAKDLSLNSIFQGIFAGYNVDIGNAFVFSIETDFNLGKSTGQHTLIAKGANVSDEYNNYYSSVPSILDKNVDSLVERFNNSKESKEKLNKYLKDAAKTDVNVNDDKHATPPIFTATRDTTASSAQQWGGATRVRLGFAKGRVMPYLAGGIAYTSIEGIWTSNDTATVITDPHTNPTIATPEPEGVKDVEFKASKTLNDTKALVGFIVGGGVDFIVSDHLVARAEYRYTDFGSQEFSFSDTNKIEYTLQGQEIRVGVAFKFE